MQSDYHTPPVCLVTCWALCLETRLHLWKTVGSPSFNNASYSLLSRYSILPAMSLDGVLHLTIQDQPYTAVEFNSFIEALLSNMNQLLQPNSVITMDNASIHKSPELCQMIEE